MGGADAIGGPDVNGLEDGASGFFRMAPTAWEIHCTSASGMPAPAAEEVGGSEAIVSVGGDTELEPAVSSGAAVDESIMERLNTPEDELEKKRKTKPTIAAK